jgi:hypothetical protein
MTTLIQQIEEMRIRMDELATKEQGLVRALGDTLSRADQRLLQDVQSVALEHEARRGAILQELQTLAARMGALPKPRVPVAALEGVPLSSRESESVLRGGDWRKAAANIQDELALHLRRRASGN